MRNSTTKVSVIMSVYNAEEVVSASIESILLQSYKNIELIIINDGSTDNSLSIIKEYEKNDDRIIVISQENKGLTKSLNVAIDRCSGKYIFRQDADDISLPFRLEKCIQIFEQLDVDFLASSAYTNTINGYIEIPNKKLINKDYLKILKYGNYFIHGTFGFKADILKQARYDESFKYAQDYELILRLLKQGKRFIFLSEPLYFFRKSKGSISAQKLKEQTTYASKACIKHLGNQRYFILNKPMPIRYVLKIIKSMEMTI